MSVKTLLRHQIWNYKIRLELGKQFIFELIYLLSEKELKMLHQYLNENEKKEFIQKSQSSAEYLILFIFKKDRTFCLYVDYQKLNEITIKNKYLLSNISELQDRLAEMKFFIKLDLKGAYNLIKMKTGEEWKTAFHIRYRYYEYTVMLFRLTNTSASCQKIINDALQEHLNIFIIIYLDNILVFSKTEKEHCDRVA